MPPILKLCITRLKHSCSLKHTTLKIKVIKSALKLIPQKIEFCQFMKILRMCMLVIKIHHFLRGAHFTAYSANVCRRMRHFVHTLVYVAHVRHKFCISYGYATIRRHTLSYAVYAQKFCACTKFPTYADVLIIRYS